LSILAADQALRCAELRCHWLNPSVSGSAPRNLTMGSIAGTFAFASKTGQNTSPYMR
jgi:hypothetical protein